MKNITKIIMFGLIVIGILLFSSCTLPVIERVTLLPPLENHEEQLNFTDGKTNFTSSDEVLVSLYEAVNPGVASIIVSSLVFITVWALWIRDKPMLWSAA